MSRRGRRHDSDCERDSDSERANRKDPKKRSLQKGHSPSPEREINRENEPPKRRRRESSRSPEKGTKRESDPSAKRRRREPASAEKEPSSNPQNEKMVEKEAEKPRKRAEEDSLLTRTGGAYIPPARLKLMQAEISDKNSLEYQRISWEALKKSIHGLINKINTSNIGIIVRELFKENIVRGRGLLSRSIMQAQSFSPTFSHVYSALVAVINSKFPQTGELILRRLVIQFRRGFRRNDKQLCLTSTRFVAHLVNQQVAHEVVALEILTLLLENPNEDSVEVAVGFLKECGMKLTEVSPKGVHAVFERLRSVLHEAQLDKRVQYMIEVMFAVRKDGFKDFQAVLKELDLVEEADQFTHLISLDEATNPEDILNVFKLDPEFEMNEDKYKGIQKAILDEDSSGSEESGSDSEEDEQAEGGETGEGNQNIIDNTETNLIALRRTIYLTIQSSLDFEECAHKLLKLELKPGQIVELCHMILDCCAQQRTYEKFYGLLAQRFCQLNKIYVEPFQEIFKTAYDTIHRFETNKLRNVAKFFAHLLYTDAIPWLVLASIRLNEDDTTSSSRIFIKILFQELCEYMSLPKLNDRVKDPTLQEGFDGLFPRDNPRNTRFAINFFTSIGLGGLTDDLREHLKTVPKVVPPPPMLIPSAAPSEKPDEHIESSSEEESSEDSSSEEEEKKKKKKPKAKHTKAKKSKHKKKDKKNKTKKSKEAVAGDVAAATLVKGVSNQEHIQRLRSEIQFLEMEQEKLAKEKERRRVAGVEPHSPEEIGNVVGKNAPRRIRAEPEEREDRRRNVWSEHDERGDNGRNTSNRNKSEQEEWDGNGRNASKQTRIEQDEREGNGRNTSKHSRIEQDDGRNASYGTRDEREFHGRNTSRKIRTEQEDIEVPGRNTSYRTRTEQEETESHRPRMSSRTRTEQEERQDKTASHRTKEYLREFESYDKTVSHRIRLDEEEKGGYGKNVSVKQRTDQEETKDRRTRSDQEGRKGRSSDEQEKGHRGREDDRERRKKEGQQEWNQRNEDDSDRRRKESQEKNRKSEDDSDVDQSRDKAQRTKETKTGRNARNRDPPQNARETSSERPRNRGESFVPDSRVRSSKSNEQERVNNYDDRRRDLTRPDIHRGKIRSDSPEHTRKNDAMERNLDRSRDRSHRDKAVIQKITRAEQFPDRTITVRRPSERDSSGTPEPQLVPGRLRSGIMEGSRYIQQLKKAKVPASSDSESSSNSSSEENKKQSQRKLPIPIPKAQGSDISDSSSDSEEDSTSSESESDQEIPKQKPNKHPVNANQRQRHRDSSSERRLRRDSSSPTVHRNSAQNNENGGDHRRDSPVRRNRDSSPIRGKNVRPRSSPPSRGDFVSRDNSRYARNENNSTKIRAPRRSPSLDRKDRTMTRRRHSRSRSVDRNGRRR